MRQSRLLAALEPDDRVRLAPFLQSVEMKPGQVLLTAGEPIANVWFPDNCVTSTVVHTPDGDTIEVGLMGFDGVVGLSLLLGRAISNTTVLLQIPGTATRMSASDFVNEVVTPRGVFYERLLQYADAFMAMVAQTAACNSLHSIDQRLARWIAMTQDRVQRSDIPLTQEFLSYMLGVRRATVSVAAGELQDDGVIAYTRGSIRVLDREALEKRACACYGTVRAIMEGLYGPREEAAS